MIQQQKKKKINKYILWSDNILIGQNCFKKCAIETCFENEIPFHFPFISPTCFTQIPQMGILVKHFFLILPLFPWRRGNWFPRQGLREFCFSIGETQSSNFLPISPDFSMITPDSPVFRAVFNTTSQVCTLSLSIRPILCILHVSLKMRIPQNARQRIINLVNSGDIQGNSEEIR